MNNKCVNWCRGNEKKFSEKKLQNLFCGKGWASWPSRGRWTTTSPVWNQGWKGETDASALYSLQQYVSLIWRLHQHVLLIRRQKKIQIGFKPKLFGLRHFNKQWIDKDWRQIFLHCRHQNVGSLLNLWSLGSHRSEPEVSALKLPITRFPRSHRSRVWSTQNLLKNKHNYQY